MLIHPRFDVGEISNSNLGNTSLCAVKYKIKEKRKSEITHARASSGFVAFRLLQISHTRGAIFRRCRKTLAALEHHQQQQQQWQQYIQSPGEIMHSTLPRLDLSASTQ